MIPLLGILYASLPKLRGNLVPHLVSIMIIGIYERLIQTGTSLQTLLVVLGHLSVLLLITTCLLYTSPSPRDLSTSRMPSSA